MKTIVLGVDTSECSKHALDWTAKNLCNPGDTLHVVRVEMPCSDCFIRYLNCGAHLLQVYCYPPLESYIGPEFVSVPSETQKDQWKVRSTGTFLPMAHVAGNGASKPGGLPCTYSEPSRRCRCPPPGARRPTGAFSLRPLIHCDP